MARKQRYSITFKGALAEEFNCVLNASNTGFAVRKAFMLFQEYHKLRTPFIVHKDLGMDIRVTRID